MRLFLLGPVVLFAVACPKAEPGQSDPIVLSKPPVVRTAMWNMAAKTNELSMLLAKEAPQPADVAQAKAIVDDIAKIAAGLSVDPSAQRNPHIKAGLPEFRAALTTAQAALATDPPDLRALKDLGASCQACHAQGKSAAPFVW